MRRTLLAGLLLLAGCASTEATTEGAPDGTGERQVFLDRSHKLYPTATSRELLDQAASTCAMLAEVDGDLDLMLDSLGPLADERYRTFVDEQIRYACPEFTVGRP